MKYDTSIPRPPGILLNVPLLDLTIQYGPIRSEILAAITRVCDSQQFIMGHYHRQIGGNFRLHALQAAVLRPVPLHRQECFAALGSDPRAFPNADAAAADVLALPIYPGLTRDQQQFVVTSIADAFR